MPRGKEKFLAVKVDDHPLEYGGFEGEIPRGEYGAGKVGIYDKGSYEEILWSKNKIKFKLNGNRENSSFVLIRVGVDRWLLKALREQPVSERSHYCLVPILESVKPNAYIFLMPMKTKPRGFTPHFAGKYWHAGIVYNGQVYETFHDGGYRISALEGRNFSGAEKIPVRLSDPRRLKQFIAQGLTCDNYVNAVLGLPANVNPHTVEVNL